MSAGYHRELSHARRDAGELAELLSRGDPGTLATTQLMQCIGLATMTLAALLRATQAQAEPAALPEGG